MPELPEVEVICRGLLPHLISRTVIAIRHSGKKLRHPTPVKTIRQDMVGNKIVGVARRAKYLQIRLKTGAMLIAHLGMTGNLAIFPATTKGAKHDHMVWSLDNGTELRYNDSRRFGSLQFLSPQETACREETIFKNIGPEPLDDHFSAEYLHTLAKGGRRTVKSFIMTSRVIAGIGNIYANEALFAAGIMPSRKVGSISRASWGQLIVKIRVVLRDAIACGGSTISDFINANQEKGYFQMNFKVYGRDGQDCLRCSTTIKKQMISGRASFFCPKCQK